MEDKSNINQYTDMNPILNQEIAAIEDPITQEICRLAIDSAREAIERGESQIDDFISKQITNQLPKLMRGSQK